MYSSIGNPVVPGAFVQNVPAAPAAVQQGSTSLIAIVGTATDGIPNQPTYFSDPTSMVSAFGTGATLPYSIVREAESAMPEGNNFVGIRAVDGTQTAATTSLLDGATSPGIVIIFVAKRPGTNANLGTCSASLRSGTMLANPVLNVTLTYPNQTPENFQGIVAYAVPGGPYNAATFQANVAAAVNGSGPSSNASANWVAAPGTSLIAPVLNTTFPASGGTDGASGVTSAQILGVPGSSNSRTGAYALGGTRFNFLIPAGNTDPSIVQELLSIAYTEGTGFVLYAYPQGSSPSQIVALKSANALSNPLLIDCAAFDQVYDPFAASSLWVSPMGKIAGIIASLDPEDDPCNQPEEGAIGVNATEFSAGQGLDTSDEALLVSNSVMWLSKGIPRNPNFFGLPHGLASDGSNISDSRMQIQVAQDIKAFLGQYVGKNQSTPPLNVPDPTPDTDDTRTKVRNGAKGLGAQYLQNGELQAFDAVCDTTNNIRSTVLAKKLILNVTGETLSNISFAIAFVQVGNTVLISGA